MSDASPFAPGSRVATLRQFAKEMKLAIQEEIRNDEQYEGEADMMMAVVDNLEEDFNGLSDNQLLEELQLKRQARIIADLSFLQQMMPELEDEEGEDFSDFEDDFDEEFADDELEIDEDDENPPRRGKSQIIKF